MRRSIDTNDPVPDEFAQVAIELLRGTVPDDASFSLSAVHHLPRRRPRTVARAVAVGVTTLMIAAGVAALLRPDDQLSIARAVGVDIDASGQRLNALGSPGTVLFSDGTLLTLQQGASSEITRRRERGADLELHGGELDVAVAAGRSAGWTIESGPFRVVVAGTRFSVGWQPRERIFEVRTREGAIEVTGPTLTQPRIVRAGEQVRIVLADPGAHAASAEEAPGTPTSMPPQLAPAPRGRVSTPLQPSFAQAVARGDYRLAVATAEASGIDRVLAAASASELSALADAARYVGSYSLAKRVLTKQRSRFPGSQSACEAAFHLGRLAEDAGGDHVAAVLWYDRYLHEAPTGRFASESLGRKVVALARAGRNGAAVDTARAYLERFPSGAYARVARQTLADATASP